MIGRRSLLAGGMAAGLLRACAPARPEFISPSGQEVEAVEHIRNPGEIRDFHLVPSAAEIDLGGPIVSTWAYGGRIPGTPIRVRAGEQIRAAVSNHLPVTTSVHWHGIALRNNADGVPGVTQEPIAVGAEYVYRFTAPDPGTYWFHPHSGLQADRGLYAPLIVDDPNEPLSYADEWMVVLDDWLDGVSGTPEAVFAELKRSRGRMMRGTTGGDVAYPYYLLNGRVPGDPAVFEGKPGERVRIRFLNAGADTAFRVAIGGHTMTVTHTDGYPVAPLETDALVLGMGERYDVLVTLGDGVFPVVAVAEGKSGNAFGLIRTSVGGAPHPAVRPAELGRRIVRYPQMKADRRVALADHQPAETIRLELTGGMMAYDWAFNGRAFDHDRIIPVSTGQRVRLDFVNSTMMFHPVHLHGHTFAVGSAAGPRKDTAIVLPGQSLAVFFDTNNPGLWMVHCHNAYHAEAGMMAMLGYRRSMG